MQSRGNSLCVPSTSEVIPARQDATRLASNLQEANQSLVETQRAFSASTIRYRIVAENAYDWVFWLSPEGMVPLCPLLRAPHRQYDSPVSVLYIPRLIVEAQAERIWAESQAGKGSTFSFALPLS